MVLASNYIRLNWTKYEKVERVTSKQTYEALKEAKAEQTYFIPYINEVKKGQTLLTYRIDIPLADDLGFTVFVFIYKQIKKLYSLN